MKNYDSKAARLASRYSEYNYLRDLDNLSKKALFVDDIIEGEPYDFNSCKKELLNKFVYEGDKNNYIFINTYNKRWEDLWIIFIND